MIIRTSLLIVLIAMMAACRHTSDPSPTAQEILDRTIEHYGGEDFFHTAISFEVGDLQYELKRDGHLTDFSVSRNVDSTLLIGRYRNGYQEYFVNGEKQEEGTYSLRILNAKLDGFTYTFSFPYVLRQNAILLERKEDQVIRGTSYLVVHASSRPIEGEPQDEVYLYIEPESYEIHYTAEQLTATGGNPIFKRYHNLRRVDSFLFADYYSFARPDTLTALKDMHKGFQNATLRSLQQVELENISVKLNNPDG